MRLCF